MLPPGVQGPGATMCSALPLPQGQEGSVVRTEEISSVALGSVY